MNDDEFEILRKSCKWNDIGTCEYYLKSDVSCCLHNCPVINEKERDKLEKVKNKVEWESLTKTENNSRTERLCVYGGWIIRSIVLSANICPIAMAMCFVPDPEHVWLSKQEITVDSIEPVIGEPVEE